MPTLGKGLSKDTPPDNLLYDAICFDSKVAPVSNQ